MGLKGVKTLGCVAALAAFGVGECQVVISEVMFDPSGNEFYDEFIEIQNLGEDPVDLKGGRIRDGEETDGIDPRAGETVFRPGGSGLCWMPAISSIQHVMIRFRKMR